MLLPIKISVLFAQSVNSLPAPVDNRPERCILHGQTVQDAVVAILVTSQAPQASSVLSLGAAKTSQSRKLTRPAKSEWQLD